MRDLPSCYGDHAVRVAGAACSSGCGAASNTAAAVQSRVTCLYRSRLSTSRELLIGITWTKGLLALAVDDLSSPTELSNNDNNNNNNSRTVLLRKKKGSRSFRSGGGAVIALYWDISGARYDHGPEPMEGFYLVVLADAEVALLVGDVSAATGAADHLGRLPGSPPPSAVKKAEFALVGRKEQVLGDSLYCTKAKFREAGRHHEIAIRCKADDGLDEKESELSVSIDKKKVVHVRRLTWNFRGNQTIFVDGLPVDMMWDCHDWRFGPEGGRARNHSPGRAVFMFRTRSEIGSRLWLEEEMLQGGAQGRRGFSLLIHAFKIS